MSSLKNILRIFRKKMSLYSEIYNSHKTEDNILNKEISYQSNKEINLRPIKIKYF